MERLVSTLDIELRSVDGRPDAPVIAGYAAVFNELSVDLRGFRERILPGAFTRSLSNDVVALFNHDPNYVLGRSSAKTLRMMEDRRGLAIEIDPPETSFARDMIVGMKRGEIRQMSFGFRVAKNGDTWDNIDGKVVRTLTDVDLFDVSVVTNPAYPQTTAEVRAIAANLNKPIPDLGAIARMKMLTVQASI